jgi:hypothetical protein
VTRLGLFLLIAFAIPGDRFVPHPFGAKPADRSVYHETRSLTPGEYQATFRLALKGGPERLPETDLHKEVAQVSVTDASAGAAVVPPQSLAIGDFPLSGASQDFSVFFCVERDTPDVTFEVLQHGDIELELDGFSLINPAEPPLRLLLVAGRGADNTGWRNFIERGSADYGLTGGNQHFLAYMVQTLPCGSLADRTRVLAEAINSLHVPDRSLRALGHSMGGLDLRLLVGLAHQRQEPYYSAAKKLAKVYTAGTPHHGTSWADAGNSIFARPLRGILCIGEPLMKDITPEAMVEFNARYPWEEFEVDGRRIPFLAFTFEARCLPWWARGWVRGTDTVVSVASQQWGQPNTPPSDLPWSAVHAPPLDLGRCVPERSFMDMLDWILNDRLPLD